jgi:hypothetical protein
MRKYRTKAGTVEEKLQGVNATVNPSEKAQIAMAGGADTLKDVQTILGQEGKRNNLKGQGAKHLVSFFTQGMGYEGMDDPEGRAGIGGFGSPSGSFESQAAPSPIVPKGWGEKAPDLSAYGDTPQEREAKAASSLKADKAAVAQTLASWVSPDYIRALKQGSYPIEPDDTNFPDAWEKGQPRPSPTGFGHKLESPLSDRPPAVQKQTRADIAQGKAEFNKEFDKGQEQGLISKIQQTKKENPEAVSIGGFLVNVLMGAAVPPAALSAALGYGIGKAMNPDKTVEETASMEDIAAKPSLRHGSEPDYETVAYNIQPTPPPDPEGGSDPKKKKKKPIRPAANNVTLGISEKRGRSTRDIMRRRGGWRFA